MENGSHIVVGKGVAKLDRDALVEEHTQPTLRT